MNFNCKSAPMLAHRGGDNSSRLLLGGLLSDLSAEHYSWVATGGGKRNPDTTTVHSRAGRAFTALRLPFPPCLQQTPPSATDAGSTEAEAEACSRRICREISS